MEIEVDPGPPPAAAGPAVRGAVHRPAGATSSACGSRAGAARPRRDDRILTLMIDELRITDLGVISEATISLHPGLTVVTGETGAGKTMIVTGLGLLLGGRADARTVRTRRRAGPGRGSASRCRDAGDRCSGCSTAGGELDDGRAAGRPAPHRGRPLPGVRRRCAGAGAGLRTRSPSPDRHPRAVRADRLAAADRPAASCWTGSPARTWPALLSRLPGAATPNARAAAAELARLRAEAQARAREIDLLRFGLEEIERVAPERRGGRRAGRRGPAAAVRRRPAAGGPGGAGGRRRAPTTRPAGRSPRSPWPARRSTRAAADDGAGRAGRPAGRDELPAGRRGRRSGPLPGRRWTPSRDGWSRSPRAGRRWPV